MKINFESIKRKISFYFKERLDQTLVVIILTITIVNAIFISVLFYLVVLNPTISSVKDLDYKEIKIKVNQDVLERLEKEKEVSQEFLDKINQARDIFVQN